jgi:histidine ammonia-lyase
VLSVDVNNSAENPLHFEGARVHHGAFHHAALALALDQLRLAVVQACGLSLSRLTKLQDPTMTGLRPFLADGPAGSSGVMVLEYTAASAFAELRTLAQPSTLGTTAISLGLEDHASFAWQSALAVVDSLAALRTMVSCELVAALRAVRQHGGPPESSALAGIVGWCDGLPDAPDDHPLVDDLDAAGVVLERMATAGVSSRERQS